MATGLQVEDVRLLKEITGHVWLLKKIAVIKLRIEELKKCLKEIMTDIRLLKENIIRIVMETSKILLKEIEKRIRLLKEKITAGMDPSMKRPWLWRLEENMIRIEGISWIPVP